jgi:hypothetical protein
MLWRHMRLDRGSDLLVGELASPWRWLLLSGGLPNTGLPLLPPPPPRMSAVLLKREAGIRP